MSPMPKRDHTITAMLALLLVATGVGVYATALHGPFLMDDFDALTPLAAAQSSGMSWWEVLQNAPSHIRGRWLANFSFLLSHAAGGAALPPAAFPYKVGNLLVHLACAATLYLLARQLLRRWGDEGPRTRNTALLAAALFLLHPLLLSTVLYPVQRMAQLATLFALLAAWNYLRWRERLAEGSALEHGVRVAAIIACIALAVSSKESGALAPLLIGVIELCAFRWPARELPWRSRFDTGFALTCAAPLLLGGLLAGLRWPSLMSGYASRDFDLTQRVLTQVHVLVEYLGQILWPRISHMGLYRDDFPLTASPDPGTLLIAAAFIVAIAAALYGRTRWPAPAFAVLWFFAAHAMESTVIPLELVFEHRNYLALAGPAIAIAWMTSRLPPRSAIVVGLVLAGLLGVQTARRAQDWRDYETWIVSESAHHPGSLRAGTDLVAYLTSRGRPEPAAEALAVLRTRFPQLAQPVLLELALRCAGASPHGEYPDAAERHLLRTGGLGKDAFHVYDGIAQRKQAGDCASVDWPTFARVAGEVAENPALHGQSRALAAWRRLHATALARSGAWAEATLAVKHVLKLQDNDPRDWVLLMHASAQMRDVATYQQARTKLLVLLGQRPGPFTEELRMLDGMMRSSTPASPAR